MQQKQTNSLLIYIIPILLLPNNPPEQHNHPSPSFRTRPYVLTFSAIPPGEKSAREAAGFPSLP
jgi:hypothetical protein